MAQFRFALIAPVVQGLYPDASATAYYKRVTQNPLVLPDGSSVTYRYKTLKKWKSLYSLGGLDAVMVPATERFYTEDEHKSRTAKSHANETAAALLNYLYDQDVLPYGYTIIIHYLALDKGSFWNEVNGDVLSEIKHCQAKCHNQTTLEAYHAAQKKISSQFSLTTFKKI